MNLSIFDKKIKPKMLRTIIVDDELHVRETLKSFLHKYCPPVKVIGEAGSFAQANKLLQSVTPDLLLLDIQLGDGNGFELLKQYESPDFKIIFITAHDQYAVQAFKVSAVDFILKPVNPLELKEAVEKAREVLKNELRIKLEALESNLSANHKHHKKLVIKTLENIYLLETSQLTHCESEGSYTRIYTTNQEVILSSRGIREYEDMLFPVGFCRCHRSYVINLAHIKRFEKSEGGSVILTGDHKIPVASRKRQMLLELFESFTE